MPIGMRMRNRPISVHPFSIEESFVLLKQIKEVRPEYRAYSSVVRAIIFWNLTGRCNLSCQYCYNSSGPDQEADTELSTKEALLFIDDCAEQSVPVILFSGGGSPPVSLSLGTGSPFKGKENNNRQENKRHAHNPGYN